MPRVEGYEAALAAAVARGPLARFPAPARAALLERGVRLDAPARTIVYRDGDPPFSGIVVRGVLRIFASAADGREFTVFWARPGEWLGHSLIAGGPMDLSAQAVRDVSIHTIPVEILGRLARSDATVAWELAREVAARLRLASTVIGMLAFMDLRERVAHRLLEAAFSRPGDAPLVAALSQQELADAVGSPRTSVARVLADLRRERIVRSVAGGVQIARPERLVPGPRAVRVA